MKHAPSPVRNRRDLEVLRTSATGDRQWSYQHFVEARVGVGPTSSTAGFGVINWPKGFHRAIGRPGELEWHPEHEEIFVTRGALLFENGAELYAPAYFNHPPFWNHPTVQTTCGEVQFVRHVSGYPQVAFESAPQDWDGSGFFATGVPTRSTPVDALHLNDLPWREVLNCGGKSSGYEAQHVWSDEDDGWQTWLVRIPPGWTAADAAIEITGAGDEVYVLDGDLTLTRHGEPATLTPGSHFCDPDMFCADPHDSSVAGCLAIRWTRGTLAGGRARLPELAS